MPLLKGNIFESLANKVWNGKYADDVGIALIHLGAAGWVLSALAQILMLANNKDIDKKEKRFLIPQEIADGMVNVGLYYSICQIIKNIVDHMSENISYMTQKNNDFLKIMKPDSRTNLEFIKGFAETFRNYGISKVKKQRQNMSAFLDGTLNYLKGVNIPDNFTPAPDFKTAFENLAKGRNLEQQIDLVEDVQRNFNSYKNGVGVIAAVGASILACNIITPVVRNIMANYSQKRLMRRNAVLTAGEKTTLQDKDFKIKQISTLHYPLPKSNTFSAFKI